MSYLPRYEPRRSARGFIDATVDGANYPQMGLFNNSTGRDILVVRDLEYVSDVDGSLATYYLQGHLTSAVGTVVAIVPGEPAPPGLFYQQLNAALTAPDYLLTGFSGGGLGWTHDFPFAFLLPGWSLVVSPRSKPTTFCQVSFFWQRCEAEDIDGSLADRMLRALSP